MAASELELFAAPLSLAGLDALSVPDLLAFVGEDERPLQGLAGFCDFRLCGALTRQVKQGVWSGRKGELVLTVTSGRLPAHRIFLFGLGSSSGQNSASVTEALDAAFAAVSRAGARAIATCPPGWGELQAELLASKLADSARAAGLKRVLLLAPDVRVAEAAFANANANANARREARGVARCSS